MYNQPNYKSVRILVHNIIYVSIVFITYVILLKLKLKKKLNVYITLLPSFWLELCENINEELVTMGSLLLKGCTVAVTGDEVAVTEDALLLLSWIPAEDVSDDTGMTGKESGSHFPVIINTRALYNNKVGRRHMMLQAHLTCDYYNCWPGGAAAAVPDGNERSENSTTPAAAAAAAARVTRPQCRHLSPSDRGSTPRRLAHNSPRRRPSRHLLRQQSLAPAAPYSSGA